MNNYVIIQGRMDREHLRAERVDGGWLFITRFPREPDRTGEPREHRHFILSDLQVSALMKRRLWEEGWTP